MPRPMVGVYSCQAYDGDGNLHHFEIRAETMLDADIRAREWCYLKKWHFDAVNNIGMIEK